MTNSHASDVFPMLGNGKLPFIGRANEFEQLLYMLKLADGGVVQVAFITGQAGIGKTTLAEKLTHQAKNQGWQTWKGQADSLGDKVAFSTLLQVLRAAIYQRETSERSELMRDYPAVSDLVMGNFNLNQSMIGADIRWDKMHAFETFRSMVIHFTKQQPAVVWLDDFSEADAESVDWLHYFIRHQEEARVLFLATCRTPFVNATAEFHQLYQTLLRHRQLQEIELRPFELFETEMLANSVVSGEVHGSAVDVIQSRTMGIPLFAVEMMRMLDENGELVIHEGKWDIQTTTKHQVPGAIKAVILERITHLAPVERDILDRVAISDGLLPWLVLQKSTGVAATILTASLSHLIELAILHEQSDGADVAYSFSHPMIREVVFAQISETSSRHLHHLLAEAYGDDLLRAAYHTRLAGSMADVERASKLLFDAGRQYLSQHAYRTASTYIEMAVAMAEKSQQTVTGNLVSLQEMKVSLCEAWANTERVGEALDLLNDLCENASSPIWKIRSKRLMARIESTRSVPNCIGHIEDGLGFWDGHSENDDVLWMLNEQMFNFLNSNNIVDARRTLDALRAYYGAFPTPRNHLILSFREAHMALFDWSSTQRTRVNVESFIAEAQNLGEPEWIYDAYGLAGYLSLNQGDYASAIRYWQDCKPLVRPYGIVTYEYSATIMGACGLFLAGKWSQALVELEAVERNARAYTVDLALGVVLDMMAVIYVMRGQAVKARACTKESQAVIARALAPELQAHPETSMDAATAVQTLALKDVKSIPESALVTWANVHGLPLFLKFVEGLLKFRAGHVDAVKHLVVQLYDAAGTDQNYAKGAANLLDGLIANESGDFSSALNLMTEATRTFEYLGVPFEHAISQMEWARALEREDVEKALSLAGQALQNFRKLEAEPFVAFAEGRLKRIQSYQADHLKHNAMSSLSEREREIVSCIARGLSNKEIAETLVLSPRTVSTHLQKIYQKLDVHSRTALLHKLEIL